MKIFITLFIISTSVIAGQNLKERAIGDYILTKTLGGNCFNEYRGLEPLKIGTKVTLVEFASHLDFIIDEKRYGTVRHIFHIFNPSFGGQSMGYSPADKYLEREYKNMKYGNQTFGGLFDRPCIKKISFAPKDNRDFMVGGMIRVGLNKGILGTCGKREKNRRIKYEIKVDGDTTTFSRFKAKKKRTHRYDLEASCTLKKVSAQ